MEGSKLVKFCFSYIMLFCISHVHVGGSPAREYTITNIIEYEYPIEAILSSC